MLEYYDKLKQKIVLELTTDMTSTDLRRRYLIFIMYTVSNLKHYLHVCTHIYNLNYMGVNVSTCF